MRDTSDLLKNSFKSPTRLLFLSHAQFLDAWIALVNSEFAIADSTQRSFWKKIAGAYFSTFPTLKLLKVINVTSWKTLFSMQIARW